jgi:hypothetical protein
MTRKDSKGRSKFIKIIKYCVVLVFLGFLIFFAFNSGANFLRHAELFKIKEIVQSPGLNLIDAGYLESLKGKSLLDIDLKSIQRYLQNKYPNMAHLRIVRILDRKSVV